VAIVKKRKSSEAEFHKHLIEAAEKLRNKDFEKSYELIIAALSENPEAPEPHNLLGIWYELNQDIKVALKHYRAAYSLDPTYTPACKNIERICTNTPYWDTSYNFGDES
jgi:Tfp pilus assembly protein PilF